MTSKQNQLVLLIAVAGSLSASTPGFSATASPDNDGDSTPLNIPYLTDQWQRTRGKFAPPESGPGPVTRPVWAEASRLNIPDYTNPVLKPWVAEILRQYAEQEQAGIPGPSAMASCWPTSVPGALGVNGQVYIAQTPNKVMLHYDNNQWFRTIYLNQAHSENVTLSWFGESVGHYEGDVLVVDTIGLVTHPMSLLDQFGTPHTEALHVVERYRLGNGGESLRVDIHVEDPGSFNTPWNAIADYNKTDEPFPERVCAENNRMIGITIGPPTAEQANF